MRSMNLQVLLINAWYHRTNTASFLHDLFTFYIYQYLQREASEPGLLPDPAQTQQHSQQRRIVSSPTPYPPD